MGLTRETPLIVTPVEETATVAPVAKFVPVRVIGTVVLRLPLGGEMDVTAGGGVLTLKLRLALVPPEVVTERCERPAWRCRRS